MKTSWKIIASAVCITAALAAFEMGFNFAAFAFFAAPFILIPEMERKSK